MVNIPSNGFKGVVGTPVTPFTKDNIFDTDTYQKLINFLINNGVNALAVPMHIGESINMTMEERQKLAEVAVEVVGGRVPVIINPSLPGTDQVITLSKHAERIGCSAVVVITPYHWQPPKEDLLDHFLSVASAIDIGVIGYNYPERLGVSLDLDTIANLVKQRENFVGVKDASTNMEYFTEGCRITSELRPGFSMFTGVEYMLPSMVVGGVGSFSACGAVAPTLVRNLYEACASGEFHRAKELQHKVSHLYNIIKVGYPATIKAAMEIMGRPAGETRKPISPPSAEAKALLRKKMTEIGILDSEPQGW